VTGDKELEQPQSRLHEDLLICQDAANRPSIPLDRTTQQGRQEVWRADRVISALDELSSKKRAGPVV
jgi:hypothetical protein